MNQTRYEYLGRLPRFPDHVRGDADFAARTCLAVARGAVGDCTRAKEHDDGIHQSSTGDAWRDVALEEEDR